MSIPFMSLALETKVKDMIDRTESMIDSITDNMNSGILNNVMAKSLDISSFELPSFTPDFNISSFTDQIEGSALSQISNLQSSVFDKLDSVTSSSFLSLTNFASSVNDFKPSLASSLISSIPGI